MSSEPKQYEPVVTELPSSSSFWLSRVCFCVRDDGTPELRIALPKLIDAERLLEVMSGKDNGRCISRIIAGVKRLPPSVDPLA